MDGSSKNIMLPLFITLPQMNDDILQLKTCFTMTVINETPGLHPLSWCSSLSSWCHYSDHQGLFIIHSWIDLYVPTELLTLVLIFRFMFNFIVNYHLLNVALVHLSCEPLMLTLNVLKRVNSLSVSRHLWQTTLGHSNRRSLSVCLVNSHICTYGC